MASDFSRYVLRRPRHPATGDLGFPVAVRRSAPDSPGPIDAGLVDLSREGFRVRSDVPLEIGESLFMDLFEETSGLRLTLPGTVRWRLAEGDGRWLLGCQSKRQLDWETLGELFLNKVLLADDS